MAKRNFYHFRTDQIKSNLSINRSSSRHRQTACFSHESRSKKPVTHGGLSWCVFPHHVPKSLSSWYCCVETFTKSWSCNVCQMFSWGIGCTLCKVVCLYIVSLRDVPAGGTSADQLVTAVTFTCWRCIGSWEDRGTVQQTRRESSCALRHPSLPIPWTENFHRGDASTKLYQTQTQPETNSALSPSFHTVFVWFVVVVRCWTSVRDLGCWRSSQHKQAQKRRAQII